MSITEGLLLTALLWPVLLSAMLVTGQSQRFLLPLAPVPLLALAVFAASGQSLDAPWLLTALRFGFEPQMQPFVLLTALVWLAAGVYRSTEREAIEQPSTAFTLFWLACFWGNTLLVLAAEMVAFYLGFTLMSLSAWGLVRHYQTEQAAYAARIYLIMALVGEVLVLAGLLLAVAENGSSAFNPPVMLPETFWLLTLGFGIKAGVIVLHVWLPLAHPAAPVAASAVLSGVMLKAGVLGWLLFLPDNGLDIGWFAYGFIGAGLLAMFYGVAVGLTQQDPKTILAYSSISQMGWLTLAVGLWLLTDQPALLWAIIGAFVLHHGLNKAALFLGVGAYKQTPSWLLLGLLALPAAALAGLPMSSGYLAKEWLKVPVYSLNPVIANVLMLAGVATTLIMLHFLFALYRAGRPRAGLAVGFSPVMLMIVPLVLLAPMLVLWQLDAETLTQLLGISSWLQAMGMILVGGGLYLAGRYWLQLRWAIPAGDILVGFAVIARWVQTGFDGLKRAEVRIENIAAAVGRQTQQQAQRMTSRLQTIETGLRDWPHFSLLLMLLALLLAGLLAF